MATQLEKGFLQIPQEVLTATKVKSIVFSFADKCVYSYLLHWSKGNDKVYPSMRRMCEDLGIGSRVSLKKYLDKLESLNLLRIDKTKGKSSTYFILPFGLDNVTKPSTKTLTGGTNIERKETTLVSTPTPIKSYEPHPLAVDWEDDEDMLPF